MIIRKTPAWFVFIGILCIVKAEESNRWSRQISNSEWIPLANPRSGQRNQGPAAAPAAPAIADSSAEGAGQVAAISLPPALQQRYQDQLLQLQKTQESIQRLLLLQQQLKAQQHVLESQAYQPNGFANVEDEKQALHQSTIVNLQTLPELAPEVLVPPVPSSEALPPVFQAQDFRPDPELKHRGQQQQRQQQHAPTSSEQDYRQAQEESIRGASQEGASVEKDYLRTRQKTRYEGAQRHKEEPPSHVNFVTPATSSAQEDSDEEIQLVYVPAETLAQRGQSKLHRAQIRKHPNPNRHHGHHGEFSSTTMSPHDAYAHEILHQLQRQHEEKNKFLNNERQKEIARLHAEQKELERQARIHQEMVRKEQEQMRQREAEKKREELAKIEELSRQRELLRIQKIRERERQEELKLAELKAKEAEERRKELERFSSYEKEKESSERVRQKEYDRSKEQETRVRPETAHIQGSNEYQTQYEVEQPNAQPLVREPQLHHQHLTEVTSKSVKNSRPRSKPRSKLHQYHQQESSQEYQESAEVQPTTPSPNQPPLSVYMGSISPDQQRIQLSDVLKTLKNARTIAVLDSFGPDTPRVFVGPRNLDPPPNYAKFDLPYLSSIENNRVERKVDKLPFFVAPLSFEPPPGYSKIPFPAPHIGSVVINSLENVEVKPIDLLNPNPTPLIEPNSYFVSNQPLPVYDVSTPQVTYPQESSTPRYEVSSLPPSQSSTKWKFREYYDNKPSTEIPAVVTAASYHEERTPTNKYDRPSKNRNYYNPNEVSTTPNYYSPKTVTAFSFEQTVPQSTPAFPEEPPRHHHVESHRIHQNPEIHQQTVNRYREPETHQQTSQRYPVDPTGHTVTNTYFLNPSTNFEDHTQYSLPAELPAISPQLPGLVNALVEKSEISSTALPPTTTTPTTTTTTTTTTETPTTTYRPRTRHRGRVTAARAPTTLSPPSRGNSERTRRPVNRSRSKYTTTTEEYRDSSYDPTRRNSVTTSRYDQDSRRPANQNYKPRDEETKESIQTQIVDSNGSNEQGQRGGNAYESVPLIDPASAPGSASGSGAGTPTADLNIPVYQQDDYSASTQSSVEDYSRGISDSILPLSGLDYVRKSTHAPTYHQTLPASYEQSGSSEEQPVNGFNYRTHEVSSTTRDYPYYRPSKTESAIFEPIANTESPNVQRSQLENFSPVYHAVSAQGQFEKNETPRPIYRESTASSSSEEEQPPIFLPIPNDKQEEYAYQTTVTEVLPEITTTTTTTTTTEAPVIIRQRVRGRLGGSTRQDSAIQTRPRGSQDEYVRFSAVNQDAKSNSRQRSRPSRTRTQQHSPIQTEGQEYVRIQSAPSQQSRRTSSTSQTTTPQTTRTTEEQRVLDEGDYGFIRQPNYRPAQQQQANYKTTQQQIAETSEVTPTTEPSQPSQAQILKNRQKYYSATRRPSSTRITTTPRSTADEGSYTVRSRGRVSQTEEAKPTKSRSRLRRPGARRRTTTTTESPIDDNNELPLDENYPRLVQDAPAPQDSYRRGQDIADENYPQEFLLNYGATQNYRRDEYDAAAEPARRHQTTARLRPTTSRTSVSSDIYGAESQWSTKLTGNSFQPSSYSANSQVDGQEKPYEAIGREKAGDFPEIITAGPDDEHLDSITVRVSSDDENVEHRQEQPSSSSEETIMDTMMNTMIDFGKKMNAEDGETTTVQQPTQTSTSENPVSVEAPSKSGPATFKKAGLRRRRVRVRVRPAGSSSEDFVTAESQSYDSSLNNLPRESIKFRNFFVTTEPATTVPTTIGTTSTTPAPEKSMFESLLDKMLGREEEAAPAATNAPEVITSAVNEDAWTSQTFAPSEVSRDEPTTTFTESSSSTSAGTTIGFHRDYTTTLKSREEGENTELPTATMTTMMDNVDPTTTTTTASSTTRKTEETKPNSSGENVIQSLTQENSLRYFATKSPAFNEYLRSQELSKMSEDDPNHPKNHRSKWSEVRDKSLFDFAKWNPKNSSAEDTSNNSNSNQATDSSSVTDYVKAIFESIKSADEEHHQNAKLAEQTSSRKDKELYIVESTSVFPTEVKTSVSSSSRVVSRGVVNGDGTTTTTESATFGPFVPSMMSDNKPSGPAKKTPLEMSLGKVLRTTTSTKVSQMTEICYRGRCVMSKPKKDGVSR